MIPTDNPALLSAKIQAISAGSRGVPASVDRVEQARAAAQRLEATFLSEMLKSAGFGLQTNSFSGSAGEDQFASFHRDAIAQQMAQSGGIGLAEHFFNAMMEAHKNAE